MPRWPLIVVAAFAAMAISPQVLIAFRHDSADDPAPPKARVIDELRGTYRGRKPSSAIRASPSSSGTTGSS